MHSIATNTSPSTRRAPKSTAARCLRTALFFSLLAFPGVAPAALVETLFVETLYPTAIERTVDDGANWYSTNVGLFHFQRTGGDYEGFNVIDFYGFCIEPREFVSPGTTYTYTWDDLENGATNIGGMGDARADQLRELYARYFPVFTSAVDPTTAQAIQIATWEIVRETSNNLDVLEGTTRFRNPGAPSALVLAQTVLSSLTGDGPALDNIFALTAEGVQDISVQETPEPASALLLGAGLLLLARFRRRRQP